MGIGGPDGDREVVFHPAGEPWQSGKAILAAAGSRSLKMSDVFKSKKNWRLLIESDGRGAYRLLGL